MPVELKKPLEWKKASVDELKMLGDLQGNILKGHGRHHTMNLFLEFQDASQAKTWIKGLSITNALEQLKAAEEFRLSKAKGEKPTDGGIFRVIAISSAGYLALGVPSAKLPTDQAFTAGMKARGASLKDPSPEPIAGAKGWEKHFRKNNIHAILIIAASKAKEVNAEFKALTKTLPDGITILGKECGVSYFNANGEGIEHFGYVDGRSQPLMLTEDIEREKHSTDGISVWNPAFPLGQALVRDPAGTDPSTSFGSFFVFRKLEQNVKEFKKLKKKLGEKLAALAVSEGKKSNPGLSQSNIQKLQEQVQERAGALMVGRFEDGTPVVLQSKEGMHSPVPNNFNYLDDPDATKCPFHSHIRKTNPRGESAVKLRISEEKERQHIMPRRGITYDELPGTPTSPGRKRKKSGKGIEFLDEPSGKAGLLFMAYMNDIAVQFEFTQAAWANAENFLNDNTGTDPIIGQAPPGTIPADQKDPQQQKCPLKWGGSLEDTPFESFNFGNVVTLLGGEYFFAPSLSGLKNL